MCKSCEQRLITKEYIATHTNLIPPFKSALYSSTLVIKCFKSNVLSRNSYYNIIGQSCLRNPHGTPTFKTKALRLVSNVQLVKRLLPCNEQQIQLITKVPPINSIDSKCRAKKLKSSRTCLIGYSFHVNGF